MGIGQPGVGLLPQFPFAERGIPLPTPRADGGPEAPLTPRVGGRWPWGTLALMLADVVQPEEKRDHFRAKPAAPPRRDILAWFKHVSECGSALQVEQSILHSPHLPAPRGA